MTQLELIMCWKDKMAEAEDMMALLLKEKNYVALRVWLNLYFENKNKVDAGELLLTKNTSPTIWGAKQSP